MVIIKMKTCSSGCPCEHRYQTSGTMGYGCNYTWYCDFQLPRDSRREDMSVVKIKRLTKGEYLNADTAVEKINEIIDKVNLL